MARKFFGTRNSILLGKMSHHGAAVAKGSVTLPNPRLAAGGYPRRLPVAPLIPDQRYYGESPEGLLTYPQDWLVTGGERCRFPAQLQLWRDALELLPVPLEDFRTMAEPDLVVIHGDNRQPVQDKSGFDGVE